MADYGSLPNNEYEVDSRPQPRVADVSGNDSSDQNAQSYLQLPQDDDEQLQKKDERASGPCINRYLVLGLAFCFASFSLTIGLLYHFSCAHNGLTTEEASRSYAWLYGPTAVVVLLRVIWRVVDSKTKETVPWHEMAAGLPLSGNAFLLDYLSPSPLPTIWTSLKAKHWAVAITTTAQLVLLISLVFITGLFSLETTIVSEMDVPLRKNQFNGSALDIRALDASPALLNLAIQTQNLSYPKGTSLDTVVPLFDTGIEIPSNTTVEASVKGLQVTMECEKLDVSNASQVNLPWYSIRAPQFLINITTPTCNITNARVGSGPNHGNVVDENNTQIHQGWMRNYVCNSGLDYMYPWGSTGDICPSGCSNSSRYLESLDRSLDDRIMVSAVDLRYTPVKNTNIPTAMWVSRLTTLLCKPSYSLDDYRVKYMGGSSNFTILSRNRTNATLEGFYSGDISKSLYQVFNDKENLYIGMGGVDYQFTTYALLPFFQMLTLLHGGEQSNVSMKDLMDPEVLRSGAETMLTGTMTQTLHQKVLSAISDTPDRGLLGAISYEQNRLHVKSLSTGFLCAFFGLLSILSLILLFNLPRKPEIGCALGSTLAVALALRHDPDLTQQVLQMDPAQQGKPEKPNESTPPLHTLQSSSNRPDAESSPRFDSQRSQDYTPINLGAKSAANLTWWHPASSRGWFSAMAASLCIIILVLLEIIQHLSDTNDGFMGVPSTALGSAVLTQYIPTAIVLGVSLIFADIETKVATFSPFVRMKKGRATASQSIAVYYHSKSGPHAFLSSIMNKHFALSVMLITTFVASFLTIVIPGLYSLHTVPVVSTQALNIDDRFEFENIDISLDDKRAGAMLNLLTYYDIPYPKWTYDNLALPKMHIVGAETEHRRDTDSTDSTLLLRTNATRARLECQKLQPPMNWTTSMRTQGFVSTTANTYLPWSLCSDLPNNLSTNSSTPWTRLTFNFNETTPESYQFGRIGIMGWGEGGMKLIMGNSVRQGWDALIEWGCPSLMFITGTVSLRNMTDLSALICTQTVQQVETDLSLDFPTMAISKDIPPRTNELTSRWLRNPTSKHNGTAFQFYLSNMILSLSNPKNSSSSIGDTKDDIDDFIQAVAYTAKKEDGLEIKDIFGFDNSDRLVTALQKVYGRYMAQALSNNMRVLWGTKAVSNITMASAPWTATASPVIVRLKPTSSTVSRRIGVNGTATLSTNATSSLFPIRPSTVPSSPVQRRAITPPQMLSGTLTRTGNGARTRVKQNRAPKIALQVMLAVMALGAILARLMQRTKHTLLREPYSIAGRAALVVNGNVLESLGKSGEKEELIDERFNLGWMRNKENKQEYGIYSTQSTVKSPR